MKRHGQIAGLILAVVTMISVVASSFIIVISEKQETYYSVPIIFGDYVAGRDYE